MRQPRSPGNLPFILLFCIFCCIFLFFDFCFSQVGEVPALPRLFPPSNLPRFLGSDAQALHDLGRWDHVGVLGVEREDRGRVGGRHQQGLWDAEDAVQGGAKYLSTISKVFPHMTP